MDVQQVDAGPSVSSNPGLSSLPAEAIQEETDRTLHQSVETSRPWTPRQGVQLMSDCDLDIISSTREESQDESTNPSLLDLPATLPPNQTSLAIPDSDALNYGELSTSRSITSLRESRRFMGDIQGIMFRHRGKGIPDTPMLHLAQLDTGANENFASMTAIQESGWADKIYLDANTGGLQGWYGQTIVTLGYVDLPCKFSFSKRRHRRVPWPSFAKWKKITFRVFGRHRRVPWFSFAKERKITFRVLGHEDLPEVPFTIGAPSIIKKIITAP